MYRKILSIILGKNIVLIFWYGFWGMITTCLNLIMFYIFSEMGFYYLFANAVAYYIAVIINYFMNYFMVFERKPECIKSIFKKMWKFIKLRTVSLLIDSVIFFIMVSVFGFHKYISRICLSIVIISFNFFWSRRNIFV